MKEKLKNSKIVFAVIVILIIVAIGSTIIYLNKSLLSGTHFNKDEILNMPDEIEELGTPLPVE